MLQLRGAYRCSDCVSVMPPAFPPDADLSYNHRRSSSSAGGISRPERSRVRVESSVTRDRLLAAIRDVYDSATDATLWPGCLLSIGRLLNGTSTNLLYHDLRSKGGIQIASGADPELYRLYREFGHAIDPWALAMRRCAVAGRVTIAASVIEHPHVKRTEFYAAIGRRYECTRALVGVLEASPDKTAVLTLNRGDRDDEFDSQDARVVSVLLPHLRRALAIQRRLGVLDSSRGSILDAVDRLTLGVILVDQHAHPIFVNRYAARVLDESDGLAIDGRSLIAAMPAAATRLDCALGSAIAVANGTALATEHAEFLIPRTAGRRALHAAVSPISRRHSYDGLATQPAAVLFIVDPETNVTPPLDRLRALYSFTSAEARVAAALAAGRNAVDMSDASGVSRETVRSQIKRVLDKANVRSQSAFIRLVATESLRLVHSRQG